MKTRKLATLLAPVFLCLTFISFADDATQPWNADHFFDSDGVQIRYIEIGEGEPVVLVHGFTASVEMNWGPGIVKELAKNYRVIGIDNRGHGKSDKPHAVEDYGTNMVDDIARLLDHLEIEKAHIVGYSMGGFITAKMTTMYPERMLSATLGGAGWMNPEIEPGSDPLNSMSTLADSLESGNGVGPLIKALTPEGTPEMTEEQIAAMSKMILMNNDSLALAAVIRGMPRLSVTRDQLEANKVPTLAAVGSIDPLVAAVNPMEGVMPSLHIVRIEGANHMTAVQSPVFMSAVQMHLGRNEGAMPLELQHTSGGSQ